MGINVGGRIREEEENEKESKRTLQYCVCLIQRQNGERMNHP